MATIRLENVSKTYSASDIARHAQYQARQNNRNNRRFQPKAEDIALSGKAVKALDHVTLTIPDGQALAVVGPSGCGKSTLLRAVAGLQDYDGDIYYDEVNVNMLQAKERYIGMVFQNYALYPHFYGHGNLSFFFKLRKAPDAETEERIRLTSEIMGIGFSDLLRRKPGTLSGGQQQRVAIARAIVRKPKLFLLDEPLSNLDAKLRTQTRVEIKRLLSRFQITTIYVTHDQTEAISIGDAIAVMREGRIIQVGTYQDLHQNPTHAFVAGFLGLPPMNLLEGTVSGTHVTLQNGTCALPQAIAAQTHNGQQLLIGFHADAATIAPDFASQQTALHLRGTVDVIEPDFGRDRQIAYVSTGTLNYRAIAPRDVHLAQGYETAIAIPHTALYFFDAKTEQRIQ